MRYNTATQLNTVFARRKERPAGSEPLEHFTAERRLTHLLLHSTQDPVVLVRTHNCHITICYSFHYDNKHLYSGVDFNALRWEWSHLLHTQSWSPSQFAVTHRGHRGGSALPHPGSAVLPPVQRLCRPPPVLLLRNEAAAREYMTG